MKIPWLALAIGLLVYLIFGSAVAAVAVFIATQLCVVIFVAAVTAALKSATKDISKLKGTK